MDMSYAHPTAKLFGALNVKQDVYFHHGPWKVRKMLHYERQRIPTISDSAKIDGFNQKYSAAFITMIHDVNNSDLGLFNLEVVRMGNALIQVPCLQISLIKK